MTELTPAQKAARTRAANKAAAAAQVDPFTDEIAEQVVPVIQHVTEEINAAAQSDYIQVVAGRVTPRIPAKVRDVLYTIGIVLGTVGAAAGPVLALLSGDAKDLATSAVGLALALSNLLAKLNLSKTATDIAKEQPTAVG